ncbi:MAG TPA: hypothetical protein VEI01_18140 [Terriglobales bacterium]|nr:hypothetical protein [Terriglobales bacterium]
MASPVNINPVPPDVHGDVWDLQDQWIKAHGIDSRVAEHALRVGFISAAVDGRPTLRAQDLGPACAFAKYQMRVRTFLAPNPGENPDARCAIKIRAWLLANAPKGEWVRKRDLDRGISSFRLGPGVFNRCLSNLAVNGEIETRERGNVLRLITTSQGEQK